MRALTTIATSTLPAIVAELDTRTQSHFLEYFTATIRNPHTRHAYSGDIGRFLGCCSGLGISELTEIHALHVSSYIEMATQTDSAPTVKRTVSAPSGE